MYNKVNKSVKLIIITVHLCSLQFGTHLEYSERFRQRLVRMSDSDFMQIKWSRVMLCSAHRPIETSKKAIQNVPERLNPSQFQRKSTFILYPEHRHGKTPGQSKLERKPGNRSESLHHEPPPRPKTSDIETPGWLQRRDGVPGWHRNALLSLLQKKRDLKLIRRESAEENEQSSWRTDCTTCGNI